MLVLEIGALDGMLYYLMVISILALSLVRFFFLIERIFGGQG